MTFDYHVGASALLVSMPHVGTKLPDGMTSRMSDEAKRVPDTDWHVDRLYDFLDELGASVLQAHFSRYVVDLNRPPDDANLYPGVSTTGLCPTDTFDDEPIYRDGDKPTAEEIAERVDTYWRPYHDQLETALSGIKEQHGYALLWDAHSIRAEVPRLFDGRLPDLNIGTAAGAACPAKLAARLEIVSKSAASYTSVLNGRFTGGFITRHYGRPSDGVIAAQLELTQSSYMEESYPFAFDEKKANKLRPVLRELLDTFVAWTPE